MKVFVDSTLDAPADWMIARSATDAIDLVRSGEVQEISVAYDLGDAEGGTGQTVILWMEQAVMAGSFRPPIITVHSARSSTRKTMEQSIRLIHQMAASPNPP